MTVTKLYKLTHDGFTWLTKNVESNLKLYSDPDADFETLLSDNVDVYKDSTDITITGNIKLTPPDPDKQKKPHLSDIQALEFYRSLDGMTPRLASDPEIWAYINHFYLHEYGIFRWPKQNKDKAIQNILFHWLSPESPTRRIYESSISGRTWWLAHTTIKAAEASGGAFTAEEALETFVNYPEYYHYSMQREIMRNPVVLAECIRSLRTDSKGINKYGYSEIIKDVNREGGAKLIDSLEQMNIRAMIQNSSYRLMKMGEYVPDRSNIKGVKKTKVLSLGAGTQSTVMALMAEEGFMDLEKPDFAIFADTHWEPPYVYEHLDWLEKQLSYDVIRVSAGDIRENVLKGITPEGRNFLDMPVFLVNKDGTKSVAARQCTNHYKIQPIHKMLRKHLKLKPGRRAPKNIQVEMWMGISTDESHRIKDSRDEWITNRYPLIDFGMTRAQLYKWFKDRYPDRELPRSACVGCPYHSNMEWKWLKENEPKSFDDAVFIDKAIREVPQISGTLKGVGYLHRERKPLDSVDFDSVEDYDDFMISECEGLCGV